MTGRASSSVPTAELRRVGRRIGLQTAGLLMACLVVVAVVAYAAVVHSQNVQMTGSLTEGAARAGLREHSDRGQGPDLSEIRGGIQYAVTTPRGVLVSDAVPSGLPDLAVVQQVASTRVADRRTVHLAAGAYEVFTTPRGTDTVQVMASLSEQHQERLRVLGALGLAGAAGLALATLAAVILARRAVRPVFQALELQRRFVADAGHELRTPLTLLSTRTQLLARRVRDTTRPDRDELIMRDAAGIVADTTTLTSILEELLMAADVRTPVPQRPIDVGALAVAAVAAAQAAAQRVGVTLTVGVDTSSPTTVAGAPTALSRSVTALIENAVDHATGRVGVRVGREGDSVVVEVADDGPGISEEMLPRMFDRFSSDRRAAAGVGARRHFGLGLALVNEIATRHRGTVTATNRSAAEPGAVLRLALPAFGPIGRPGL